MTTSRFFVAAFGLLGMGAGGGGVEVMTLDWDGTIQSPCNGEPIHFTGEVEYRAQVIETVAGRTVTSVHISYNQLEAVGLESGTVYDVTGSFHNGYQQDGSAANEIYVNRFHFVAPAPENDVTYDETFHVAVSPDGETRVVVDDFSSVCR
jgi:hypothetical protein